jgi:hypothetical protein
MPQQRPRTRRRWRWRLKLRPARLASSRPPIAWAKYCGCHCGATFHSCRVLCEADVNCCASKKRCRKDGYELKHKHDHLRQHRLKQPVAADPEYRWFPSRVRSNTIHMNPVRVITQRCKRGNSRLSAEPKSSNSFVLRLRTSCRNMFASVQPALRAARIRHARAETEPSTGKTFTLLQDHCGSVTPPDAKVAGKHHDP